MLYSCHTRDSTRLKIRHHRLPLNDAVRVFSIQISLPYRVGGLSEAYFELSLATAYEFEIFFDNEPDNHGNRTITVQ